MSEYCSNGHYAEGVSVCNCGCDEMLCDDCKQDHMKSLYNGEIEDYCDDDDDDDCDDCVHWTEFACPECRTLDEVIYRRNTETFYCEGCKEEYSADYDISQLVCVECNEPLPIDKYGNIEFDNSLLAPYCLECYRKVMSSEACARAYKEYNEGDDL